MKSVNSVMNTIVVTFDTATEVIRDSGVILTNSASALANLAQVGNVASKKLLREQEQDLESWELEAKQRVAEHGLEAALKLSDTQLRIQEAVKNNPALSKLLPQTLEYLGITDNTATTK